MTLGLILLIVGMTLSAFFSGSETGFYRASRTRLVLDALEGDRTCRRLLYLVNRPTLFVATALVGNNVANYLVSLSVVLLTKAIVGAGSGIEMAASILVTPAVFVYGELLPKNLFFQAPNRLLRSVAPVFMAFAILFAPVSAVLWWLGQILEKMVGQSPTRVRLNLAKEELGDVLVEGHEAGIFHPAQLELSRSFFEVATLPVTQWMEPLRRHPALASDIDRKQALRLLRARGFNTLAIRETNTGRFSGYVNAIELALGDSKNASIDELVQALPEVGSSMLFGEAIMLLFTTKAEMAVVVDENNRQLGIVRKATLVASLLSNRLFGRTTAVRVANVPLG